MTAPNDDQDVDVPLRLQPVVARPEGWRGRSINLVAVGLVGFVVLGVVLGTAFDNGAPASSAVAVASDGPSSTPRPTRRPTPTPLPLATPLPTLEVNGELPTERRLVWGNGQQILDLGSGTMRSFGRQYEDVLWPVGDELVCVCLIRTPGTTTPAPLLRFARFDLDGELIVGHDLVALEGAVPVAEMTEGFNMTAAINSGAKRLVVVDVVRRPPNWVVELHVVGATSGELLDSIVVDTFPVDLEEPRPSASPRTDGGAPDGGAPDGVYAWASTVALAPDGGSALVTVAKSEVRGDEWTGKNLEWIVPVVDDQAGEPVPLSADASLAIERWCIGRSTFLEDEVIVGVCGPTAEPFDASFWSVRRLTADGRSLGDVPIGAADSNGGSAAATIVDRERRAVYLWDPFRHLMSRVDVDDGRAREGVVPESMLPGDRAQQNRGWIGVDPGLVASPDGTRLFALGLIQGPSEVGVSTGVWVFHADTLELLDRWTPRALLTSLAVSADGRFVYAVGATGYDADGNPNPRWTASVTVYDARNGTIDVLYGAIGDEGQWLAFQPGY